MQLVTANGFTGLSKDELVTKLAAAKRRISSIAEKGEEVAGRGIAGVEILAGAAAAGWWNGAHGGGGAAQIAGYDADMAVGGVLALAGLFGLAGKHSDHLLYVGAGALGSWVNREAYAKGAASTSASGTVVTQAKAA